MPAYEYRCGKGHVTTRVLRVAQHKDRILCGTDGCGDVAEQFLSRPPHSHSGKIIWLGSEVYGDKKLRSDELREDTEAAMVSGADVARPPDVDKAIERTLSGDVKQAQ